MVTLVVLSFLLAAGSWWIWWFERRAHEQERRNHGDTKDELAEAKKALLSALPLRTTAQETLKASQAALGAHASSLAAARQSAYRLQLICDQMVERGHVTPTLRDQITAMVDSTVRSMDARVKEGEDAATMFEGSAADMLAKTEVNGATLEADEHAMKIIEKYRRAGP